MSFTAEERVTASRSTSQQRYHEKQAADRCVCMVNCKAAVQSSRWVEDGVCRLADRTIMYDAEDKSPGGGMQCSDTSVSTLFTTKYAALIQPERDLL